MARLLAFAMNPAEKMFSRRLARDNGVAFEFVRAMANDYLLLDINSAER